MTANADLGAGDRVSMIQAGCVLWHSARFPETGKLDVLAKLTEEVGEVARALLGELEGRPGRGDVCDEAAQCVLVLATLVGRYYDRDLLADAAAELDRVWRADFANVPPTDGSASS